MEWMKEQGKETDNFNQTLSMYEYMEEFEKNPMSQCRPSFIYIKDMFDHFGKTINGEFEVFQHKYKNNSIVYGQVRPENEIYQNLKTFEEEGHCNKFLLLVGPNGSSKSSLIKKIMEGCEEYSQLDDGKLFTFSWIFPVEGPGSGRNSLGFSNLGTTSKDNTEGTYANLEEKDMGLILPSELRDHPLLLIPQKTRQELLEKCFSHHANFWRMIQKSYLYQGDMSKRNRMIFDALLKSYQGNIKKVYRHIRVERFIISRRYSTATCTVEPQMHVDAHMQQITMDKRLSHLPPGLQSLNLFSMQGELVNANRGILEYSDLLKRPLDAFKYLLMTMETNTINIQGILTELDILYLGSSNEIHLTAFKQHPDYNSFKGRMNFIRVPYLLNFHDEQKIYIDQINILHSSKKEDSCFAPKALETLCQWSVMTRLRPCQNKNYVDKQLAQLAHSLTPMEKVLLLSDKIVPERFNSEEKKCLKMGLEFILSEYYHETLYEGKFGISPREVKQIIYDISTQYKHITFLEVLEYLHKFIERKNEFDFLNMAQQGDFNNPKRFIEILSDYQTNQFDLQLRESLGLVDERSYEQYIEKYIYNITYLIKKEKIKNKITGQFEDVDMYLIKEFENNIKLKEKQDIFRSNLLSFLGAYSLDNPDKKIKYTEVFPDIVKSLKESYREDQKKIIQKMGKNLVFYKNELAQDKKTNAALDEEGRNQIITVLKNLKDKFEYTEQAAMELLTFLMNKLY